MTAKKSDYSSRSDDELVELFNKGDTNAFNELAARYLYIIAYVARKYYARDYEQNDFIQEGLLGLLSACRNYKPEKSAAFKNYLILVVERRFISVIKHSNSGRSVPDSAIVEMNKLDEEQDSFSNSPEELVIADEQLSLLYNQLKAELSELEFNVLIMYVKGMSYSETAKKLNISEKAVDNALQRARRKVKRSYMP